MIHDQSFSGKLSIVNYKKYMYPMVIITGLSILLAAVIAWATAPAVPDFSKYPQGNERKQVFFNYFRPLIEKQNQSVDVVRARLKNWYSERHKLSPFAQTQVRTLARDYGLMKFDISNDQHWQALFGRADIVPVSLALAQAAIESAWGTSRFARGVQNYFGQWCFSKDCGMVPLNRAPGANHELEGFSSPQAAVASYVHNLNTHRAYEPFREIRARLRSENKPLSGMELAGGLTHYSALGVKYVRKLRILIKNNRLSQYD